MSDPFETLGFEPHFDLDRKLLEARHRELSRSLHPDRYVGRPASERRMALSKAIEVNQALRKLQDPVQRAEALLARHGALAEEGREAQPRPDFLMEILELREALSSARSAANLEQVRKLAEGVTSRQENALQALSSAFAACAKVAFPELTQRTLEISSLLSEVRYYQRFLEEARAIEDELE
ncbi:MAG TPA: Fe-S protein assembly co-chaperone HscB [Polyangiaceae bacterium]|nr:Fe-S protein assembly co-chaperone HscB [Polyangiaceae bacterium]